jgi:SAM-dependent methyltransferase
MSSTAHDRPAVYQDENRRELQRVFEANVPSGGLRKVLDAGCGYKLPIDVPRGAHLTGIDISPAALEKNTNADERLLGDIQTYPLPKDEFDAVISWWVLEHVPRPAAAIANMASCLRPGGLLVLGVPHVYSMKAAVTKLTPYRFHVWVVRRFFGIPNAGAPGVEPYRTYLSRDLAPARIRTLLAQHQMTPIYTVMHHSGAEEALPPGLRSVWSLIAGTLRRATFGRWDPLADEYVALFRKTLTSP